VGQAGAALVPAPRVERALVALAHQTQQLDDRLDRLERRLDASIDAGLDAPTHDDVVQVRVHSAKVAAELARMTVELRAEIDAAMAAAKEPTRYLTPEERRLHTVAETIIDLSDRLDTLPVDRDRRAASA
jgi:hypothetical protein